MIFNIADYGAVFKPFVFTVDGTSGTFTIPTNTASYTYDYNVRVVETGQTYLNQTGDCTVTFTGTPLLDTYTLEITGTFPAIYFNNTGDRLKFKTIEQWGSQVWKRFAYSFWGCANMTYNATDAPDLTDVTEMQAIFAYCTLFNGNISSWDTSSVINMQSLFANATAFNQDIGSWDTSSVIIMQNMFANATAFNQDIGNWNTSSAANMVTMFNNASSFNQDLSCWNVSLIASEPTDFDTGATAWTAPKPIWGTSPFVFTVDGSSTFTIPTNTASYTYDYNVRVVETGQTYINQTGDCTITFSPTGTTRTLKISGTFPQIYFNNTGDRLKFKTILQWGTNVWASFYKAFYVCPNLLCTATDVPDLSVCTDCTRMFHGAGSLQISNLNDWDVSNIKIMDRMFAECQTLNNSVASWDTSAVTNMTTMFYRCFVFNQDISGWDTSFVTNMSQMFYQCADFNQDLSGWCVSGIPSKPTDFDFGTTSWVTTNRQPIWGTCP